MMRLPCTVFSKVSLIAILYLFSVLTFVEFGCAPTVAPAAKPHDDGRESEEPVLG